MFSWLWFYQQNACCLRTRNVKTPAVQFLQIRYLSTLQGLLLVFLHDSCLELMKATLHQVFRATCQFFIEATLFNKPMSPGLLQLQAPDLIFAKHLKHLKAPDNNLQARGLDIKTAEIHHSKAQGLLVLQVRGLNRLKVLETNNLKVPWLLLF
ncbi:uncharacterized protein LOC144099203 isoform X2 [Amblyomma americanum]